MYTLIPLPAITHICGTCFQLLTRCGRVGSALWPACARPHRTPLQNSRARTVDRCHPDLLSCWTGSKPPRDSLLRQKMRWVPRPSAGPDGASCGKLKPFSCYARPRRGRRSGGAGGGQSHTDEQTLRRRAGTAATVLGTVPARPHRGGQAQALTCHGLHLHQVTKATPVRLLPLHLQPVLGQHGQPQAAARWGNRTGWPGLTPSDHPKQLLGARGTDPEWCMEAFAPLGGSEGPMAPLRGL